MGKVKQSSCVKGIKHFNVSIPYGKGKDAESSEEASESKYQSPMGKVKSGNRDGISFCKIIILSINPLWER